MTAPSALEPDRMREDDGWLLQYLFLLVALVSAASGVTRLVTAALPAGDRLVGPEPADVALGDIISVGTRVVTADAVAPQPVAAALVWGGVWALHAWFLERSPLAPAGQRRHLVALAGSAVGLVTLATGVAGVLSFRAGTGLPGDRRLRAHRDPGAGCRTACGPGRRSSASHPHDVRACWWCSA